MTGYLSGLLERERSGPGPGAIVPGLPSRYEPWQRASAKVEETEEPAAMSTRELAKSEPGPTSMLGGPLSSPAPATPGGRRAAAAGHLDRPHDPGPVGQAPPDRPERTREAAELRPSLPLSRSPELAEPLGIVRDQPAAFTGQGLPNTRIRTSPPKPVSAEPVPAHTAEKSSVLAVPPASPRDTPPGIAPAPRAPMPAVPIPIGPIPVTLLPIASVPAPRDSNGRASADSNGAGAHRREPAETVVQVTIGRIEVRAVPAPARPDLPARVPPPMSLDEYLRRRHGGRG